MIKNVYINLDIPIRMRSQVQTYRNRSYMDCVIFVILVQPNDSCNSDHANLINLKINHSHSSK